MEPNSTGKEVQLAKSQRTEFGFRNPSGSSRAGSFWRLQFRGLRPGLNKRTAADHRAEPLKPDTKFLKMNRIEPTITWLGHGTFLLQVGGVNVLTDPHLSERASTLCWFGGTRVVPPPLDFRDLPHIHAVVISHNHYEHLDRATVSRLISQKHGAPRFFVPLGLKSWVRSAGYAKCVELDWWQWVQHLGLTLHMVPAHHWSGRAPWDRNRTLWGGWIVDHPGFRFYFAGDTGYSQELIQIGRKFAPIDLAAIPIGGYEPRRLVGRYHVNPEEAVRIHQDVGARHSVGMNWGTFALGREPLHEPPRRLAEARGVAGLKESEFFVMQQGETRSLGLFRHMSAMGVAAARSPSVKRSEEGSDGLSTVPIYKPG